MVWINSEIGEKKRLAAWLWTSSIGLNRHKHRIDLGESLRIVALQYPPFPGGAVLEENSQIKSSFGLGASPAPGLKCVRILESGLVIEIIGIKDERFAVGVKHSTIG